MESFKFNNETHLTPILGTVSAQLGIASVPASVATETTCLAKVTDRHHLGLVQLVAEELQLDSIDSILDFELLLYDVQEATIGIQSFSLRSLLIFHEAASTTSSFLLRDWTTLGCASQQSMDL